MLPCRQSISGNLLLILGDYYRVYRVYGDESIRVVINMRINVADRNGSETGTLYGQMDIASIIGCVSLFFLLIVQTPDHSRPGTRTYREMTYKCNGDT